MDADGEQGPGGNGKRVLATFTGMGGSGSMGRKPESGPVRLLWARGLQALPKLAASSVLHQTP